MAFKFGKEPPPLPKTRKPSYEDRLDYTNAEWNYLMTGGYEDNAPDPRVVAKLAAELVRADVLLEKYGHNPKNPYRQVDGLWYWYDETGDDCGEGFATEEGAKEALDDYVFYLETGMTKYAAQMAHGV